MEKYDSGKIWKINTREGRSSGDAEIDIESIQEQQKQGEKVEVGNKNQMREVKNLENC